MRRTAIQCSSFKEPERCWRVKCTCGVGDSITEQKGGVPLLEPAKDASRGCIWGIRRKGKVKPGSKSEASICSFLRDRWATAVGFPLRGGPL